MKEKPIHIHAKNPKWIKTMVILIPLMIFGYLIYNNFLISQEFNYFYDIGSEKDKSKPYLTPLERTSDTYYLEENNYRNINHQLIYFSVPSTNGINDMDVEIKLIKNFDSNITFGIKNSSIGWNYTWFNMDQVQIDESESLAKVSFSLDTAYKDNNNKISMFLYMRNLNNDKNETYSIDWINITVHKPALWSRK